MTRRKTATIKAVFLSSLYPEMNYCYLIKGINGLIVLILKLIVHSRIVQNTLSMQWSNEQYYCSTSHKTR